MIFMNWPTKLKIVTTHKQVLMVEKMSINWEKRTIIFMTLYFSSNILIFFWYGMFTPVWATLLVGLGVSSPNPTSKACHVWPGSCVHPDSSSTSVILNHDKPSSLRSVNICHSLAGPSSEGWQDFSILRIVTHLLLESNLTSHKFRELQDHCKVLARHIRLLGLSSRTWFTRVRMRISES